jgi:hypothetical protein
MTELQPWTWREFHKRMKAAGWRLDSSTGCFEHKETHAFFYPFNYTRYRHDKYGNGELWYSYAIKNELPVEVPF